VNKREDMVMNEIAKNTTLWGKWFIFFASLILCVGMGATQALAAADTTLNNFTMRSPTGSAVGGTNDVHFTWDGTTKTSVAAAGQVSNATITSSCPFQGKTWSAHDVAVYGPGTYTVYAGCPEGSPGCGTGTAITFTVGATELGAHMLFNWNLSTNIDVVDVWTPHAVFAPSPMHTVACGSNPANTVWDLMSNDWNGDGINGRGMVDGPFMNFNANFNVMVCGNCNDNDACTIDSCDLATATCVHTPVSGTCCVGHADGTVCDDGDVCTGNDVCFNEACVGTPKCDDNDACTTDSCDVSGTCTHTQTNCDDSNVCTTDTCDSSTGDCVYVNNTSSCDDNDACTEGDVCSGGTCSSGTYIPGPTCNVACSPAPTLIYPTDGQSGLGSTVEFRWTKCGDTDGDALKYHVTYCITPDAMGCPSIVDVADASKKNSKSVFYASGAGLFMIGLTFIGGFRGRKKIIALLIIVTLCAGGAFIACGITSDKNVGTPLGDNEMNYMASGLTPSTTYYWKVEADDSRGGLVSSVSYSFTTQ